jgi:CheY-like chemotaxis protein
VLLGGTLDVTSREGAGSSFTLWLPERLPWAPSAPPTEAARPEAVAASTDPGRDETVRDRAFVGRRILVLMDVMMPEMDGLQATREIRRQPELAHLPIVVLTTSTSRSDQERTLDAGASDHLAKPIDIDRLTGILRARLPQSSAGARRHFPPTSSVGG